MGTSTTSVAPTTCGSSPGRNARVVIHEADAPMLRARRAHVQEYLDGRGRYLRDPEGEAKQVKVTGAAISGEMEPTMVLTGGETLSLGGDVTVSVHPIPGHRPGAVAYVVDGQNDVFVGDSVEMYGAASGFPAYDDPDAYRASLIHLRDRDPAEQDVPRPRVPPCRR